MVNNTQLSKILADQILAKISNQLIVNKQYNTIYQSSFGEYEIANYKGELLIKNQDMVFIMGLKLKKSQI